MTEALKTQGRGPVRDALPLPRKGADQSYGRAVAGMTPEGNGPAPDHRSTRKVDRISLARRTEPNEHFVTNNFQSIDFMQ